ncbi:LacI family DNA-binding transcriptional regulator [Dictyobacter formicarum]|uniref:LacI family transcriptional regulator n=1 Tax=Dictyobacter formicarum TaxID=2778368 RepID=A0ABQ3VCL6_9CHLR|nr:LacI family DNA-binding transcriptional regulator [Dictyobacter formicarum]GHO83647.1 LacI family transcriptional regulator [Dictyobacter formicarum]
MTTIYDIARAAGVTATTVSNVLSGKGSVSSATRARVMQYAEELNYSPNLVARSLIKGRTGVLGLVFPSIDNPFYAEITAAMERLAYQAGFRIFVSTFSNGDQTGQKMLKDLALRRVDGVIIFSAAISLDIIHAMALPHLPIIYCLEEEMQACPFPALSYNFFQGGQLAGEHLLSLGHRHIGLLTHMTDEGEYCHVARVKGLQAALATYNLELDSRLVKNGISSVEPGKIVGRELLTQPNRPTAVFATNDMMAIGLMAAAWELNIQIPRDLSVIGFDGIAISRFTTPPLTTIKIDIDRLAAEAINLLLHNIENPLSSQTIVLPAQLLAGASTGPLHL